MTAPDKYVGNRYTDATVTVIPVYFPKAAFIYFPQTSGGQVVNHGSADSNDIMKVNRVDTVNLRAAANEGKYVKGFNVLSSVGSDYKIYSDSDASKADIKSFRNNKLSAAKNLLVADNTAVTWKENNSSVISLRPHGLVTKIEPYYDDPKMIVAANPKNQYKDKGSVIYIDGDNSQAAGYDETGNLKIIQIAPMTMGKTYTFNSVADDSYITKWQDFTGDANGDGVLSEDENNEALNIDRSAVVSSIYNYIAKITPKFYGDDELLSEEEIGELVSGQEVSAGVIAKGSKIKAELYSGDRLLTTSETQIDYAPKIKITDADMEISGRYSADFDVSVTNIGTADIEDADVKIISAATGEVVAEDKLDLISVGETKEIKLTADIDDNMFKQNEANNEDYYYCETGDFNIVVGTESYDIGAVRYITNGEHKLLSSVSPVLNDGNASLDIEVGGYGLVYDSVTDDYSSLQVKWTSSDESIASVNSNGLVTGVSEGTAEITAYIMPADRTINVLSDGSSVKEDIYNEIPSEGIIVKTIDVNVLNQLTTEDTTETTTTAVRSSSGGGGGSSKIKTAAGESTTETTTEAATEAINDNAAETAENTENNAAKNVFDDVKGTWAETAVTALAEMGIVSGVGGNSFAPERNITRAEYVTMLIRLLGDKADVDTAGTEQFADCGDGWYSEYILKAKTLGIAAGYENNKFKPESNISRQEMFAFTERALISFGIIEAADDDYALKYDDADSISLYAIEPIRNLTAAGIITGSDSLIKPNDYAKRNEAAQMMYGVVTKAQW